MIEGRTLDYLVIALYLAVILVLGLRLGRGQKSAEAFLLGSRNLPWFAVLGSIVATETSSVTFLSVPGLSFAEGGSGFLFLQLTVGYIIGRCLVVVLLLPQYFAGSLFTAYQVLEQRFGGATKYLASALFLLMRNLADGLRLYLTALVLQVLLGWHIAWSILVVAMVTTVYTFYGGLRSVVWNDCLQLAIYLAGAIVALLLIAGALGAGAGEGLVALVAGLGEIVRFGQETGRFRLLNLQFSLVEPYTIWSGLIGGIFVALATHGTDQLMVQRYLAARTLRDAAKALVTSGVVVAAQFALFLFLGVSLAAYYHRMDPQAANLPPDQAFAHFVVHGLPPGLSGLVIAAVLAAAMSTLSSSLNASASAAINDFYAPWRFRHTADRPDLLWHSRIVTLFFAAIQVAVAVSGPYWTRSVIENVMAIATITSGVTLGIFLLGVLVPQANQRAALYGVVAGCVIDGVAVFSGAVSWPWYAMIGAVTVLVFGGLESLSTKRPSAPASHDSHS